MDELFIGRRVIVRTYSAGVHFGTLEKRQGKEVLLSNSRRLWEWTGAFTLSAVAQTGITGGRIAMVVPEIVLTEAIEVIPCSDQAAATIMEARTHTP